MQRVAGLTTDRCSDSGRSACDVQTGRRSTHGSCYYALQTDRFRRIYVSRSTARRCSASVSRTDQRHVEFRSPRCRSSGRSRRCWARSTTRSPRTSESSGSPTRWLALVARSSCRAATRCLCRHCARFVNGRAYTKDATGTPRSWCASPTELGHRRIDSSHDIEDQMTTRPARRSLFAWSRLAESPWYRPEAIVQSAHQVIPGRTRPNVVRDYQAGSRGAR